VGRRRKCRFVAALPEVTVFKPQGVPAGQLYGVVLGLDGFEALRLVDGEGLSQEEAAVLMQVSRPTLCRVLAEARTKVARALSRGWAIRIEVDAQLAAAGTEEQELTAPPCCRRDGCGRRRGRTPGGGSCQDVRDKVEEDRAAGAAADRADAAGAEPVLAAAE